MAAKSPSREAGTSRLFEFVRELLAKESPATIARRAGVQAPTLYRWSKGEVVADQLVLAERVLQSCGYGIEIFRIPPPEPPPFTLVVRDAPSPPTR